MASTRLSRTAGTPTLNTKHTISMWFKRSKLSYGDCFLIDGYQDGNNRFKLSFDSSDRLECYNTHGGSYTYTVITNRKFRDTSAWYHIVVAVDTTQSTDTNRVKLYVNGVQETDLATNNSPSINLANNVINESGATISIGDYQGGSNAFDGSMSHIHFCDGTQLAPTVFGSTDSTTGEWKINTSPSFTLGNNGFTILKDGNTITDQSSNSNNFTLASGTLTKTEDCPSNVFSVWNNLNFVQSKAYPVFSNGNTKMNGTHDATYPNAISTLAIPKSGKYYAEFKNVGTQNFAVGICDMDKGTEALRTANTTIYNTSFNGAVSVRKDGNVLMNGSEVSGVIPTVATNDICMIAYDADNGAFYAGRNGTWGTIGGVVGVPTSGSSRTGATNISAQSWFTTSSHQGFIVGSTSQSQYAIVEANFGNGYFGTTAVSSAGSNASGVGIFEYDVPTGYTALSTKGLNL
jgi:hypothetical protein